MQRTGAWRKLVGRVHARGELGGIRLVLIMTAYRIALDTVYLYPKNREAAR